MNTLSDFVKTKDYLVCVDSDGCAMDTMDIKHVTCFGPCMVAEWGLEAWREPILARWNEINLYTLTRGINRFKGLAQALAEIDAAYTPIDGIDALCRWADTAPELSNGALEALIADGAHPIFGKALAFAHERADVAIVSSANRGAVLEEWARHGLLPHTDVVLTQNDGSKAYCIGELLKKGYAPDHVLMCGDAPGDLAAAQKNGVFYYPILVRQEAASWQEFMDAGFAHLLDGTFGGAYQDRKIAQFNENLGG